MGIINSGAGRGPYRSPPSSLLAQLSVPSQWQSLGRVSASCCPSRSVQLLLEQLPHFKTWKSKSGNN